MLALTASAAFGKLQRDPETGSVLAWHPLLDHMADVAACFAMLCQIPTIRRALQQYAKRTLNQRDIDRLSVFAFLHDLGKANCGFQAKRWHSSHIPADWPRHAGHVLEAVILFTRCDRYPAAEQLLEHLQLQQMSEWGDAGYSLLMASISHHGKPVADDARGISACIWQAAGDYDPALLLQQMASTVRRLYPHAFEQDGETLPNPPAFVHYFAGLMQLADWLGSDTRFFPYSEPDEDRGSTAIQRATKAVQAIGLDTSAWRSALVAKSPTFSAAFAVPDARPVQAAMADASLGRLVIVEDETGGGKTEAAVWRFLQLFQQGLVDSLYFALPTRVAATQVHQRINAIMQRLWPHAAPPVVRALPGYAAADDADMVQLPDFKVLWTDDPGEAVAHLRWAAESPKRFLAAPVAIGTIDQALQAALQIRHAHLRHALLARSLLVVDEVHASDSYMGVLLEQLLHMQLGAAGHALLLSATLGSAARERYLAIGRGKAPGREPPINFTSACALPYPAVSDEGGTLAISGSGRSKTVSWELLDALDRPEHIASLALQAAAQGTKVLIVRNTVPAAIATLRALEAACPDPAWLFQLNGIATLHHSRFSREDRPLLDAAVEAALGKYRPTGPCIVIGTQTLEQSLDIDADLLITDLCPMDILLQRLGREHRHERAAGVRPVMFSTPKAWVLTPSGHDLAPMLQRPRHGLGRFREGGGVYPDLRVMQATCKLITDHPSVTIPDQNRFLVEAATHPACLAHVEKEWGEGWRRLGQHISADSGAQQVVGRLHTLQIDLPFEDTRFPTDVAVATRLGAQDRIVQFSATALGPFGQPLRQLPLRYHMLPHDLAADSQPVEITQRDDGIEFLLGAARYRYSRFGLERLRQD